jgi:hypothetical protein
MWKRFKWSTRCPYEILIKLEFSRHIFKKDQVSNFIKIRPVGGGRPDRQRDRRKDGHNKDTNRFSQLSQRAKKDKKTSMSSVGFKAAIPITERPQTYALNRMATGINEIENCCYLIT